MQFGDARRQIIENIMKSVWPMNLVIEAPLSVCFDSNRNPTGRSIERFGGKTRYWYNGLGCAVMVAAMYLIRDIYEADAPIPVRLFEGFISYKNQSMHSDHEADVCLLRDVVRNPSKFPDSIYEPDQLKSLPGDTLSSAFTVAGIDCGIPTVLKPRLPAS